MLFDAKMKREVVELRVADFFSCLFMCIELYTISACQCTCGFSSEHHAWYSLSAHSQTTQTMVCLAAQHCTVLYMVLCISYMSFMQILLGT